MWQTSAQANPAQPGNYFSIESPSLGRRRSAWAYPPAPGQWRPMSGWTPPPSPGSRGQPPAAAVVMPASHYDTPPEKETPRESREHMKRMDSPDYPCILRVINTIYSCIYSSHDLYRVCFIYGYIYIYISDNNIYIYFKVAMSRASMCTPILKYHTVYFYDMTRCQLLFCTLLWSATILFICI